MYLFYKSHILLYSSSIFLNQPVIDRASEVQKKRHGVLVLIIHIRKVRLTTINMRSVDMANKELFSPGNLVLIEDCMMGRYLVFCIVQGIGVKIFMRIGLQMRDLLPEFQITLFLAEATPIDLVLSRQLFRGMLDLVVHLCSLQGVIRVII